MEMDWLKDKKVRDQLLIGSAGLLLAGVLYAVGVFVSLPKPEEITGILRAAESVQIYDRTGKILLSEASGDKQRSILPPEEIPSHARQATLAIEDASFYDHGAFEWKGILRAITVNVARGKLAQGGSTITQQLARNAFLTPEKTITRKIKEGVLAVRLEQYYDKDEVLDLYLNHIPYGRNYYGIESASQAFFNKPARELTLAEAALVAAVPQAPTYYSPWGTHVPELLERKNLVLKKMESLGYITKGQLTTALGEDIQFARQPIGVIKAPHFVNHVQDYLALKYGEGFVQTGHLKVITTLDWELQQIAEEAVKNGAERNSRLYAGGNAALLAMDPQTGQVLAMVGSKNYYGKPEPEGCTQGKTCRFEGNFNVATQGLRQPGSAFKPFVYLTAFEKGFTPETIVWDVPTEFNTGCPAYPNFSVREGSCYHPQNFDGHFRGPVMLKEALAQSINVPAVKALYLSGLANALDTASRFGITTLTDPKRYGLSLVLGGGEIRMIELLGAYSVLATEGTYREPTPILKIEDAEGKVLEEYKDKGEEVVSPQYPRLINAILTSGELRAPLYQASFALTQVPGYEVALKTGTTDNYVDAWTFGYTPNLAAGVWAGNNNQRALASQGSSLLAALPMWHDFMSKAVPKRPFAAFGGPDPVSADNPILRGEFPGGELHDTLYYLNRTDDSQFSHWEAGVRSWLTSNQVDLGRFGIGTGTPLPAPPEIRDSQIIIDVSSPQNGAFVNRSIKLEFKARSLNPISEVRIYLNDRLVDKRTGRDKELNYKKTLSVNNLESQNLLVIRVEDGAGVKAEEELVLFTE